MPRAGDSPLARFAHAIVHENGFSLGAPRALEDGSRVIVPVLRRNPRPRRYTLAMEAAEALSAVDLGRLDRLRVQNDSETRLFLPPGSTFEGRGTAARATTMGVFLEPSASCEIEVKCVQPARPVRAGEVLTLGAELASDDVAQALLTKDQGRVWAMVAASRAAATVSQPTGPSPTDNAECGRVFLGAQGVLVAEICDHPEVWTALRRRPSGVPSPPNPLGLNSARAVRVVCEFLERLPSHAYHPASSESWVLAEPAVEFTVLGDEVVHLLAFGRDLEVAAFRTPGVAAPEEIESGANEESSALLAVPDLGAAEGDVAVAARPVAAAEEVLPQAARPRQRKVLTSGWDSPTFESLERLSRKEFQGDRSAAIRTLVRQGLRQRGYMGPQPLPHAPSSTIAAADAGPDPDESALASVEIRIQDYERIAATEAYADWLRKRARLELERLAAAGTESIRAAARDALGRLPREAPPEEISQPEEIEPEDREHEVPPAALPPPVDVRPLLRRAFAASAGGRYPEALTLFDDVLAAEPDNRTALLGRAVALRRSGKAQDALDALDAVLRAEPTNAAALLNRGRLLQERGDLKAALEAFDLLSTVAPNDWDVWLVRGDVLAKLGRRPEALQAYSEAQRRNPDDESLALRIRTLESAESALAPPPTPRIPLPRDVQEGQSYLVQEGRPNLSLRVLRALAARGVPSLAITSRSPDAVRRGVGITGVRILELTHAPGEGRHDPTALATLSHLVGRFIQEGRGHGVIALDGLASLVLENGSRDTLLFIERVHEVVLQSHAIFLVSVAPGDLSDREVALLERSLRTLS